VSGWTIAWLTWIAAFLAIEIPGLLNKTPGDTLSEHVWKWFATGNPKQPANAHFIRARRFALLAGMAWLSVHFLTGGLW